MINYLSHSSHSDLHFVPKTVHVILLLHIFVQPLVVCILTATDTIAVSYNYYEVIICTAVENILLQAQLYIESTLYC